MSRTHERPCLTARLLIAVLLPLWLLQTRSPASAAGILTGCEFERPPAKDIRSVFPPILDPPTLDGDLQDPTWARCPRLDLTSDMPGGTVSRETSIRVYRDDANLYVAFECIEPAVANLPALKEKQEPPQDVWAPENVQVCLQPPGPSNNFFVLAVDQNGGRYDWSLQNGLAWSPEWQAKTARTEDKWTAELAIPLAALGLAPPYEGTTWNTNFGRDIAATGEQCSWQPTMGNRRNAGQWGKMFFGTLSAYQAQARTLKLNLYPERWVVRPGTRQLRLVADIESSSPELGEMKLRIDVNSIPDEGDPVTIETIMIPVSAPHANISLNPQTIPVGRFGVHALLQDNREDVLAVAKISLFREKDGEPAEEKNGSIPLRVSPANTGQDAPVTWPITTGVALPRGHLRSPSHVRLRDARGVEVPCEASIRSRWPDDGSIQWLGLDFQAILRNGQESAYRLEYGPGISRKPFKGFIRRSPVLPLDVVGDEWAINTGPLLFTVQSNMFTGIGDAWIDLDGNGQFEWREQVLHTEGETGPYIKTPNGSMYMLQADPKSKLNLETWNEFRTVLRGSGRLLLKGAPGRSAPDDSASGVHEIGSCIVRIHAFSGQPFLHARYTFILGKRAAYEPIADVGVAHLFDLRSPHRVDFGLPESVQTVPPADKPIAFVKDSARQFTLQTIGGAAGTETRGEGAENWVSTSGSNGGMVIALRDMDHLYPKEFEIDAGKAGSIHFWPVHGSGITHRARQITNMEAIGGLNFIHNSQMLDLRVPAAYAKGPEEGMPEIKEVQEMLFSDATGIALVYDVFYIFFPGKFDRALASNTVSIFEQQPHASQDVDSLRAAGVLKTMLPPERANRAADVAAALLELEEKWPEAGDFNYMDVHREWPTARKQRSLSERWVGFTDDLPGLLWTLYMETGRPDIYLAARRNTRHVLSSEICRCATPAQISQADPRRRKIPGAFGDSHTPIHWQSTCHVNDRYARLRAPLLSYCLTDDRLARETLDLWIEAAKCYGIPTRGADGAAFMDNLSQALDFNYDAQLLHRLGACVDYFLSMPSSAKDALSVLPDLWEFAVRTKDSRAIELASQIEGQTQKERQAFIADFEKAADSLNKNVTADKLGLTWPKLATYVRYAAIPVDGTAESR